MALIYWKKKAGYINFLVGSYSINNYYVSFLISLGTTASRANVNPWRHYMVTRHAIIIDIDCD